MQLLQSTKRSGMMGMTFAAGILMLAVLTGCGSLAGNMVRGSGQIKSETRPVDGVTAVTLDTSGDLTIVQGETNSLTIESDDNILPLLTSTVKGSVVELGTRSNTSISTGTIKYTLTVSKLTEITVNGSGDVNAGAINGDTLTITLNGSGDVVLASVTLTGKQTIHVNGSGALTISTLTAPSLNMKGTGSGDVTLSGAVPDAEIELDGSGDLNGNLLDTATVKIESNGSGNVTLRVSETLDASIDGSGSVSYTGDPQVTGERNGSGKVNKAG